MTLRNEPHDGDEAPTGGPAVYIRFKSSSQPKGQDGYELAVSSTATIDDVNRTMLLAAAAREQAQAVLDGTYQGDAVNVELRDFGSFATLETLGAMEPDRAAWDDQIEEARRTAAKAAAAGLTPGAVEAMAFAAMARDHGR